MKKFYYEYLFLKTFTKNPNPTNVYVLYIIHYCSWAHSIEILHFQIIIWAYFNKKNYMRWSRTLQLASQKFDKLTSTCGHIFSYARQCPFIKKKRLLLFMLLEFKCGHFKPIPDEKLSKIKFLGQIKFSDFWHMQKKTSYAKFLPPSFRSRNQVQKIKCTPHYQTEFDGESEK